MKKITLALLLGLILSWFMAAPLGAISADWKLVARVKGKVEGYLQQKQSWQTIWQAILMQDGDKARTYSDSRAKIIFADDSSVLIGENSLVEIDKFNYQPQTRQIQLKILVGKIRASVSKFLGKDSSFEVITPNGVLSARGTEFFVEQQQEMDLTAGEDEISQANSMGNTYVRVFSGTVYANTPLGSFPIFAGQSAQLTGGGQFFLNPAYFTPTGSLPPGGTGNGGDTGNPPGTDGTNPPDGNGNLPGGGTANPDLDLQLPEFSGSNIPNPPASTLGLTPHSGSLVPVEPGNGGILPPNPSGNGNLQIIVNPPTGNQPVIIH